VNLITFMISDSRAAAILAKRIGGSPEQWRLFLEKDRKRAILGDRPRVPFEGEPEDPAYAEECVYEFARLIEKKRGLAYIPPSPPRWLRISCDAAPDFDHEHERAMVAISVCAGSSSACARLPLLEAKEFASEVLRTIDQLEGMTPAEIIASYDMVDGRESANG